MKKRWFILLLVIAAGRVSATITLPKVLGHRMVLQRNEPVPVWGNASPGEGVEVRFAGQVKKTTADAAGLWQVRLDAMSASDVGRELVVRGSNEVRLQEVLVGEVWLCSGQSNMEYSMRKNSKVLLRETLADSPVDELQRAKD